MLKAYIDDSNLSQGATAVLGGWVASEEAWASLSDEWQAILQMKPKIRYFKYSEAYSLTGEFSGFSQRSRDEKVKFLVAAIARHNPRAVVSAIPHELHREIFGQNSDRVIRRPYWLLCYGIVTAIVRYMMEQKRLEPIEFIFDNQDGQMTAVIESWEKLREVVPLEVSEIIENPPKFQRSTSVVALQAADLSVGWSREQADAKWLNQEIRPVPWGETGDQLQCLSRYWTREMLFELRSLGAKVG